MTDFTVQPITLLKSYRLLLESQPQKTQTAALGRETLASFCL